MNLTLSIVVVIISSVFGAYAAVLMKLGAERLKFNLKSVLRNKYLIGGVFIYGAGTIVYIIALRGAPLSILYPLCSTTYIWIAFISQKLLGERMNRAKWIGILLILVGVSLIGLGAR
jgi:drug/metabolite transporter (DMT)-like permease